MSSGTTDSFPQLIGHIGGINARLAMILAPGREADHITVLPCADFAVLREAIEHYLGTTKLPRARYVHFFSLTIVSLVLLLFNEWRSQDVKGNEIQSQRGAIL